MAPTDDKGARRRVETRRPLATPQIWSRVKFLDGSLRSVRHPLTGCTECCLFDVLRAASFPPESWHYWGHRLRADGLPIRAEGVDNRIELITSHGAIRYLLFAYVKPSHRRRVAFMQLLRGERESRR
jgi:hypothetical protein